VRSGPSRARPVADGGAGARRRECTRPRRQGLLYIFDAILESARTRGRASALPSTPRWGVSTPVENHLRLTRLDDAGFGTCVVSGLGLDAKTSARNRRLSLRRSRLWGHYSCTQRRVSSRSPSVVHSRARMASDVFDLIRDAVTHRGPPPIAISAVSPCTIRRHDLRAYNGESCGRRPNGPVSRRRCSVRRFVIDARRGLPLTSTPSVPRKWLCGPDCRTGALRHVCGRTPNGRCAPRLTR